jgi:hypothetical protein
MKQSKTIAVAAVLASGLSAAPALAGGTGPRVSLRVEGLSNTILKATSVNVPARGSITKGGVPSGLCPADSAQGALAVGTHGHWSGKWYASYREYEVTGIKGVKPNPKRDYFEIFVNGTPASAGACEIRLRRGDQLLFAVVPDSGPAELPLALHTSRFGRRLTVSVTAPGKRGVPGVTVHVAGHSRSTNAQGTVTFTGLPVRSLMVTAAKRGFIRDETTVKVK